MQTFCKVLQPSKCKQFLFCSCQHFNFMVIFENKMLNSDGERLKVADEWITLFLGVHRPLWKKSSGLSKHSYGHFFWTKCLLREFYDDHRSIWTVPTFLRPATFDPDRLLLIPECRLVCPCPGSLNPSISGLKNTVKILIEISTVSQSVKI